MKGTRQLDSPWLHPRAAYVHIPFCLQHCSYCDFAVVAGRDERIDEYLDALGCELRGLQEPHPVATLFVGGGTPTHLNCVQLERLLDLLATWLPLEPGHEYTVEANPETLTDDRIALLASHAVTRLSLGAQSFSARVLTALTRSHHAADIRRSVTRARERIDTVSLDLIFGVPGTTLADWRQDLDETLSLGIGHVSTYGLTYEKGTLLWKQKRDGQVHALDEQTELTMYEHSMDRLQSAGFEHYEISSFARPGRRCRHNQVYWANHAYLGFGLGAARYVNGTREVNTRDLATYLDRCRSGRSPTMQSETLSPLDRARETLTVQLRRAEGIERMSFHAQTGFDLDELAGATIRRLVELALLADNGISVRLTRRGKCVADSLTLEFLK
ncbi:MAG: radical SAM family heme chaperone HemW [Planctomycetes bacterium]|nr:radical SAM family heme chaperone HemW [Planctomycetota bacterium]